jgi:cell division protein FtsI (penicillin-binding protein 3)
VATPQPAATDKPQGSTHTQPVNAAANAGAATNVRANPASAPPRTATTVVVNDGKTLRVPSLTGLPVRKVIEQAAAAGFEVQITGTGTAREQAPAPGSMVAPGTKIVVMCGR